MILGSDTYERIFRQMVDEKDKVRYYVEKNKLKIDKKLRSTLEVPIWYCEPITLPMTHNTYLLYYYALTWEEVKAGSCFSGAPLILNNDKGERMAILLRKMRVTGDGKCE